MNEYISVMGGYPGLREIVILEGLPRPVFGFLQDATQEDPDFLGEYLIPTLARDDAAQAILGDLSDALCDYELDVQGMGELGYLGKSFFRKVGKAVRKVHAAIEKKIVPKPLRKIEAKMKKVEQKVTKSVKKVGKKIWVKYGGIIIEIAGVILSIVFPPAGPIIMAAASVLATANTMYQKKRAAQRAKQAASKDAAQMQIEANQANAQTEQQVDKFYHDNQAWFESYAITPDKWAKLTLDQKIALIDAASKGKLPPGAVQVQDPNAGAAGGGAPGSAPGFAPGGSTQMPSGGGPMPSRGDAGADWGSSTPYGGGMPGAQGGAQAAPKDQMAEASMFGDMGGGLLPVALVGGALLFSGALGKGGGRRSSSRKRRNPSRRRRR